MIIVIVPRNSIVLTFAAPINARKGCYSFFISKVGAELIRITCIITLLALYPTLIIGLSKHETKLGVGAESGQFIFLHLQTMG